MWMGRGGDEEQVEQRMFLYPSWLLKKVKVGKMHFWQSLASFSENNDVQFSVGGPSLSMSGN